MPRYRFQCLVCENIQTVFIGINETLNDCSECDSKNCMSKLFDKFYSKNEPHSQQKIGSITKKYIKDNKEILEQQKKEARNTEYEPS